MIEISFLVFAVIALALFLVLPPATAVAVVCFGGWLLLPVGNYPAGSANAVFPYWITGTALPSDMLLTKMWWPPVVALAGALVTDQSMIRRFQIGWADLPVLCWCLWPLVQGPLVEGPNPPPWIASLYLFASWGTPWLLGRIYFSGFEGYRLFVIALTASLVIIVPIALLEGGWGPKVYGWVYESHPFRFDGIERYIGFRPLGFFEDGNQYGIWVAATALAAVWLPMFQGCGRKEPWLFAVPSLAIIVALASQSIGAIVLLFAGIVISLMLWKGGSRRLVWVAVLFVVVGGGAYLSGKLPLRSLAENTGVGRHIVDLVRGFGRGSFTWRIARDQAGLAALSEQVVLGTGHWDWWRESGQRPWSLVLLIIGQYGIVGLLFHLAMFGAAILRPALGHENAAGPLIAIVCIAAGDSLLNSFFLYPVIVAAGALVTRSRVSPNASVDFTSDKVKHELPVSDQTGSISRNSKRGVDCGSIGRSDLSK